MSDTCARDLPNRHRIHGQPPLPCKCHDHPTQTTWFRNIYTMPIIKRHPHHTRATHRHTADPLLKAVQQGERLTTASSYPGRDLRHTLSIYIQGRIAHFKYVESATYSPTYIDVDSAECYKTRERKRRQFCVRSREAEKPGPLPPDDLTNRTGTALACHASCRRFETKLWSRHPENWSSRGAPVPGRQSRIDFGKQYRTADK